MTEDGNKPDPMLLGIFNRPQGGLDAADIIALALSAIWLIGCIVVFTVLRPSTGGGQAGFILTLLAVFLPVALIWIGAMVTKTARIMRAETLRLQGALDAMRNAYVSQSHGGKPDMERKLDQLAAAQRQTQATLAGLITPEQTPEQQAAADAQPSLGLETAPQGPSLTIDDFIGALDFPADENDHVGFGQLKRAMESIEAGKLVRSAQDILTLIAEDGIYMDDLTPEIAPTETWRAFAKGTRGAEVSEIGGITHDDHLDRLTDRMRADPVFRDTAHHFLREYDKALAGFVDVATDDDITNLAATRSSMAFMLIARAAGVFS